MLIGLMSLKNQVVYIQFHPVAYMVKLNIEMSMASLITKLVKGSIQDRNNEFMVQSSSHNHTHHTSQTTAIGLKSGIRNHASVTSKARPDPSKDLDEELGGIRTLTEFDIRVQNLAEEYRGSGSESGVDEGFDERKKETMRVGVSDDELPLSPPIVSLKTSRKIQTRK